MAAETTENVIQLAEKLSDGFAALSGEYQLLIDQQRQLEDKLSWAKQQYLDLLKKFTPDTVPQDHLGFLQNLEQITYDQFTLSPSWFDQLAQSEDANRRTRASLIGHAAKASTKLAELTNRNEGVKIWNGPSADREKSSLSIQSNTYQGSNTLKMERDFTTPGKPSRLGCPFASGVGRKLSDSGKQSPLATPRSSISRMTSSARRSKRPSFNDPIRAEICGNDPVSASASIEESAPVCPIRFLDQHSPEELAKYFENHKHELPRSHEVCVKRFQSNSDSIRQLDAKYGNLVSMIQGLGVKHQPWLPKEPEDSLEEPIDERESTEKVKKWAKAVSASLHEGEAGDGPGSLRDIPEEERTPHFDRPLKEIRVGESPSRPWGITVPTKYTKPRSASSVKSAATASPPSKMKILGLVPESPAKPSGCPFDHTKLRTETEAHPKSSPIEPEPSLRLPREPRRSESLPSPELDRSPRDLPKTTPQMVFNGPVFIGYPPDQIMTFLQHSNLGGKL